MFHWFKSFYSAPSASARGSSRSKTDEHNHQKSFEEEEETEFHLIDRNRPKR
jgi:hypothetical protein